MHGVTLMWLVQDQARGQRMDTGYFVPVLSPRLKSRGPRRRMSRLGVRVGERERERERGLGRVGNRQPGKAKLPLGAARFVSSACVVWAGGRTDVLIAFCIVGRAKSATHARSPGGCLSVCVPVRVWAFGGLAVACKPATRRRPLGAARDGTADLRDA
jgi:hypothetical protein